MHETRKERLNDEIVITYFSMEIGLDAEMPTYSGGLGEILSVWTSQNGA